VPKEIKPSLSVSFAYYRKERSHPTIALARELSIAPLIRASWSVEGPEASDEAIRLAQEIVRLRRAYMNHACYCLYDFGFASFEQYLSEDETLQLKPLLCDNISVLLDNDGTFDGVVVRDPLNSLNAVHLLPDQCVFLGLGAEAQTYFGTGHLEKARETYVDWKEANASARRYDRKVAGSFLQLTYAIGESPDENGVMVDRAILAKKYVEQFESSGTAITPVDREAFLNKAQAQLPPDFKLEFLSDSTPRQGSFIERQKYLDSLMVRAFMLPERAILEGQFGTKAEAEAHSNLALVAMESVHEFLTEEFERQVLKPHLALMLGDEAADSVSLTAGSISNENLLWKRSLLEKLIASKPELIDVDALMDEVGLPKAEAVAELSSV